MVRSPWLVYSWRFTTRGSCDVSRRTGIHTDEQNEVEYGYILKNQNGTRSFIKELGKYSKFEKFLILYLL
jgi:hypothetical protein